MANPIEEGRRRTGVAFVGPRVDSEGGIAMVLKNYTRTNFWSAFNCVLYPTSSEHSTPNASIWYQLCQVIAFLPWLLRTSPRVVSIHTSSRRCFYRSVAYLAIARLCKRPVVLHIHPVSFIAFQQNSNGVVRLLVRMAFSQSDRIAVLGDDIRAGFGAIYRGDKLTVIPNPVDLSEYQFHERRLPADGRKTVLFLGWIVREKGVYDLVDAIPAVLDKIPGARFVFAGNKEVDQLRKMLRERGLEHVTSVPGWIGGNAKLALLRDSHLLVLPSYSEGLPNVILEAMASGLPVLTTPVGGIPSVVENGRTGLLVPPADVHSLAAGIIRLLQEPELGQQLAVAARARIEARYSLEHISHILGETYRQYFEMPGARPIIDHDL